jgi:hypothetical protein
MLTVVRIALAFEILLICVEGAVPAFHSYLPLGGTHLAQLGLVLGSAIIVVDIWQSLPHGTNRNPSRPSTMN